MYVYLCVYACKCVTLPPGSQYGVWRVLLDLDLPPLLLRAGYTLLSSEEQVALPALAACDAAAAAAVQRAKEAIEVERHERAVREVEVWSTLYEQQAPVEGGEEVTCGICLCEIEEGEVVRRLKCPGGHVFHRWLQCGAQALNPEP